MTATISYGGIIKIISDRKTDLLKTLENNLNPILKVDKRRKEVTAEGTYSIFARIKELDEVLKLLEERLMPTTFSIDSNGTDTSNKFRGKIEKVYTVRSTSAAVPSHKEIIQPDYVGDDKSKDIMNEKD